MLVLPDMCDFMRKIACMIVFDRHTFWRGLIGKTVIVTARSHPLRQIDVVVYRLRDLTVIKDAVNGRAGENAYVVITDSIAKNGAYQFDFACGYTAARGINRAYQRPGIGCDLGQGRGQKQTAKIARDVLAFNFHNQDL